MVRVIMSLCVQGVEEKNLREHDMLLLMNMHR